jgi:site-specific recombinase XerD
MVKKLAIAARLKRLSPHKLRHTFGSRLVQRGVDIVVVRDLLGHSSIAITSLYLHADAAKFKDAVNRL